MFFKILIAWFGLGYLGKVCQPKPIQPKLQNFFDLNPTHQPVKIKKPAQGVGFGSLDWWVDCNTLSICQTIPLPQRKIWNQQFVIFFLFSLPSSFINLYLLPISNRCIWMGKKQQINEEIWTILGEREKRRRNVC